MVLRVCLMDKSSILVERENLESMFTELNTSKFILSREGELINRNFIKFVRVSSHPNLPEKAKKE